MEKRQTISAGMFRADIAGMVNPCLTMDELFEPLSISMAVNQISVVLGCSPCIVFCSGSTNITLSHIQKIERCIIGGKERVYQITCKNYGPA